MVDYCGGLSKITENIVKGTIHFHSKMYEIAFQWVYRSMYIAEKVTCRLIEFISRLKYLNVLPGKKKKITDSLKACRIKVWFVKLKKKGEKVVPPTTLYFPKHALRSLPSQESMCVGKWVTTSWSRFSKECGQQESLFSLADTEKMLFIYLR